MSKAVEIEFLMRDRVSSGIANTGRAVDALGGKADMTARSIRGIGDAIESEGVRMERAGKRMLQGAMGIFTLQQGSEFIQKVVDIRAEREMLEKSFEVLLQSKIEARKMIQEMVQLAIDSPIQLTPIAKVGQTLLGFGVPANEIMTVLRQLSDVSMGNQQRFEALGLAYAQVQAAGKLMGQDLLQLVNAGFNPLKVISEQTGRSMAQLKKDMGDGRISAQQVAEAFELATSKGGKFEGMTKSQAKAIEGVKSTYKDAIVNAYNKLGEANEDLIISSYKMATKVVQNYEPIIKVLGTLIATVGTYKAALFTMHAVDKAKETTLYTAEAEELAKLLPAKEQAAGADIQAAVASGRLSQAKAEAITAIRAEVAAKLEELKINAAAAQSEMASAKAAHAAALQRASASRSLVTQREMELSLATLSGDAAQIEIAQKSLLQAQEERSIAVKARKATADTLSIAQSKAAAAATAAETMQTNIDTASTVAATRAKNIFSVASMRAAKAMKSLRLAFMNNPIGIILTGLVAVTTALSLFSSETEEAEENILGLARAQKKAGEEYNTEAARIETLRSVMKNGNVAYDERKRALSELKRIIPEYNGMLTKEGEIINDNTVAIDRYLVQLNRQIKMKALQEELAEAYKAQYEQQKKYDDAYRKVSAMRTNSAYHQKPIVDVAGFLGLRDIQKAEKELAVEKTKLEDINRLVADLNSELTLTSNEPGVISGIQTFAEQVKAASGDVERLKGELADLLAGKGEKADFAQAIEDKKKELDAAQKKLDTLLNVDKTTKKAATDANRQKVEAGERVKQIEDYTRQVSEKVTDSELEIAQAFIDAMDDGVEKEQAQIALNYQKLLLENRKRRDEMVKELQKAERLTWENEHPDYKEQGLVFTPTVTEANLTDAQKWVLKRHDDAANAYRSKANADLLKSILLDYETYEQKRLRVAKEYDDRIAFMRANNTDGSFDGNIKNALKEKDRALSELDTSMQGSSELWGQLFDTFSRYTNKQMQEIIDNARQVLEYVNSTPEADIVPKFGLTVEQLRNLKINAVDLAAAYDALAAKMQSLNQRNPFSAMISSLRRLRENTESVRTAEKELEDAQASGDKTTIRDAKEKLSALKRQEALLKGDLKDAAGAAASYLGDVGSSLQQIGEASGDAGLASFGKALSDVSGIAEKFISGDIIGGAISAVTVGLTAIFSSRAKYRAALKQMRDDRIAFEHEYAMAMSDLRLEAKDATNSFGEDMFLKAVAALKELQANYDAFIEHVNRNETVVGSGFFGEIKQKLLEARGITTDLQNIWIQTRHATWFRSAKGQYLKDMYPELFEGENGFDVEAARALLATNNQLNDEAKRQLQEVIDLYDQWQEAEEQFKEYLNSTFGEIGSSLGDSIVEAFKEGTDAKDLWAKSFSNTLEKLAKQLMYTLFFKKRFDQLEKDLTAIYEEHGDDPNEVAYRVEALLGSFFNGLGGQVDAAESWYKDFAKRAEQYGFDMSGDGYQQTGRAGAFQAMDQETGTELKGLFTSVQGHTASMDDQFHDLTDGIYRIGDKLSEVSDNTRRSADRLLEILNYIKIIKRDGVKAL